MLLPHNLCSRYYLALKNLPKKRGGQKRTFINPLTHNDNIHYLQMTTFTTYKWQHPLLAMKNTLTKMESPSPSTLSEKLRVWSFCLKLSQVLKSCFWACFWHLLVSQRLNDGQAIFARLERDEFLSSKLVRVLRPTWGKVYGTKNSSPPPLPSSSFSTWSMGSSYDVFGVEENHRGVKKWAQ